MSGLQSDVVDGFNGFVAEQRGKPGECALTLVHFDSNDPYEVIHDPVPIGKVPDLTPEQYRPRSATPLLPCRASIAKGSDHRGVHRRTGKRVSPLVRIPADADQ